ncbi:hypothetical protein MEX01_16880 [Methylorubrum extorquens]|nr:hypothetical protein MEX01_16880 [Methylorubrum extorquens]
MPQPLPMTKYLISFAAEAMILSDEELRAASDESHAVIEEAKAAGVYAFGGGIDETIAPVMVGGDGSVSFKTYLGSRLNGGFAVLEVPAREEAVEWARKLATVCRCAQSKTVARSGWSIGKTREWITSPQTGSLSEPSSISTPACLGA